MNNFRLGQITCCWYQYLLAVSLTNQFSFPNIDPTYHCSETIPLSLRYMAFQDSPNLIYSLFLLLRTGISEATEQRSTVFQSSDRNLQMVIKRFTTALQASRNRFPQSSLASYLGNQHSLFQQHSLAEYSFQECGAWWPPSQDLFAVTRCSWTSRGGWSISAMLSWKLCECSSGASAY